MIRMMCGVTLRDKLKSDDLQKMIGLHDDIVMCVTRARLRWYGHVVRRDENAGIKRAWQYKVEGKVGKGRPKLTWDEVVQSDLKKFRLNGKDALNRDVWKAAVKGDPANPRKRGKNAVK